MKSSHPSKLQTLLQPLGGLFSSSQVVQAPGDEPQFIVRTAELGDIGVVWEEIGKRGNAIVRAGGAGLDETNALIPALAEGLERYSMCVFRSEQFIWATANELGAEALNLDLLPRCSPSELSHSKCPLVLPDKSKRIRWVRGLSVLDGRPLWIPAVLVYSHVGYAVPEERFWIPISTGCAAHVSYERALLAGIYELAERDTLTVTWLQQLALPQIEIDSAPASFACYWERYMKASADLKYLFFDATSDLGVPTAYGLQIAAHNARVHTLVACGTGLTMADALSKAVLEMLVLRLAFRKEWPTPQSWDDFTELLHGATFMARADSADAFQFLIQSGRSRRLSQMPAVQTEHKALESVLDRLKQKCLDVYVVDLSTDEALRSDMRVLRVIIPGLQPLSFRHRARFLGHPRLYSAPAAMGYVSRPEEKLNPWPQPFA